MKRALVVTVIVVLVGAAAVSGYFWLRSSDTSPESTSTRLTPAPSLPVSAECSIPLTTSADGNVSPLLCPNGGVNVRAWQVYATNNLLVMEQPRDATEQQVYQAMCSDIASGHTTDPTEESAEELAAYYNGWSFGEDQSLTSPSVLAGCPA